MFLQESEWLWPAYRSVDSATTLSATTIFATASGWHGKDQLSLKLSGQGRQMAERLHFFGLPPSSPLAARFRSWSQDKLRSASHSAWGCYSYTT